MSWQANFKFFNHTSSDLKLCVHLSSLDFMFLEIGTIIIDEIAWFPYIFINFNEVTGKITCYNDGFHQFLPESWSKLA